jgi:hypothetical protein
MSTPLASGTDVGQCDTGVISGSCPLPPNPQLPQELFGKAPERAVVHIDNDRVLWWHLVWHAMAL